MDQTIETEIKNGIKGAIVAQGATLDESPNTPERVLRVNGQVIDFQVKEELTGGNPWQRRGTGRYYVNVGYYGKVQCFKTLKKLGHPNYSAIAEYMIHEAAVANEQQKIHDAAREQATVNFRTLLQICKEEGIHPAPNCINADKNGFKIDLCKTITDPEVLRKFLVFVEAMGWNGYRLE